jgi:CDP-glucose 4,6-dehydratase
MGVDPGFWSGRRVLVTGHTGFKGSWLSLWLQELGADLHGFGYAPRDERSLFAGARVGDGMRSIEGDVRDAEALRRALADVRPEVVVHLAAQPLVRRSFAIPVETYETNVVGTANLLAASGDARAVIVVTSDKCYAPPADGRPCREGDPLGGADPYSASKACQELVTASWRSSFGAGGPAIASARAGNVIGGGDWADDRLVPDAMRAALDGRPLVLRNPDAVRPWQHVLNPLYGYLILAQRLCEDSAAAEAWNFGPAPEDELPVREIVARLDELWPDGIEWRVEPDTGRPETQVLRVDSSKARQELGWSARWELEQGLAQTVDWFSAGRDGEDTRAVTVRQIEAYSAALR